MLNFFKRSASQTKPQQAQPQPSANRQGNGIRNQNIAQSDLQPRLGQAYQSQQPVKPQQGKQLNQFFYTTDLKLRENFAEHLLNLELELESPSLTIDSVTMLLELYREAVEYFEAIQSNKYLIFKNKIQALLTRKNVIDLMKFSVPENKPVPEAKFQNIEQDVQKQKELQIRLNYIRGQDQKPQVETFISQQQQEQQKMDQIIQEDISGQNQALQKRIQTRRNSSVKKDTGQLFVVNRTPNKEEEVDQEIITSLSSVKTNHMPAIKLNQPKPYQHYQNRGRPNQIPLGEDQKITTSNFDSNNSKDQFEDS